MAKGTNLAVWLDLQNHPLGSKTGENFGVASNYQIPPARIYVVNHTRKQVWKRIKVGVSSRRGAEEALIYDKQLAEIYNVDTLYRAVDTGKDMNRYESTIHPIVFSFKVGGRVCAIPPARDDKTPPPRVEVPEGAWDLFLGNYERMRGTKRDRFGAVIEGPPNQEVIQDEQVRLATHWRMRHNPVMCFTDDDATTDYKNPYGFLEFIRVTQRAIQEPIDKEYLAALDLVEV